MYKALAGGGVWHAGIQLCWRDDPEVIVTANVCVFLGTVGRVRSSYGVGEGRGEQAGCGRGFSFCKRSWFKGNHVSAERISVPRNGAAALGGLIWFPLQPLF